MTHRPTNLPPQRLSFGAVDVDFDNPIAIERFTIRAAIEGTHFFSNGDTIDDWRAKLRKLGVPDDMENANEIQRAIAAAFGVQPDARYAEKRNLPASEAWALTCFATVDSELRGLIATRDMGATLPTETARILEAAIVNRAVQLGRIMEWWRWRSAGLDRRAKAKLDDERRIGGPANEGRTAYNARRQKEKEARYERILEIARTAGNRKGGALNDYIRGKMKDDPASDSTIERAIKVN